jgi:hypothetical protein
LRGLIAIFIENAPFTAAILIEAAKFPVLPHL